MSYTVRTPYNYEPTMGSILDPISLTIPDDSMPLQEILRRHQMGLTTMGNGKEAFYEEDELPDLDKMDMEEIAQMVINNKQRIEEMQSELQQQKQKSKTEEDRKSFEAAVKLAAEIKSKSVKTPPEKNKFGKVSINHYLIY